jgi:hypothetical protein
VETKVATDRANKKVTTTAVSGAQGTGTWTRLARSHNRLQQMTLLFFRLPLRFRAVMSDPSVTFIGLALCPERQLP